MHTTIYELFDSFNYVEDDELKELLKLTDTMYENDFKGFAHTSLGTNKKDVLSFCIIYRYIEENCPINNLIWAVTSFNEDFFLHTLVHLENISCIKTKNLLPYFAVSAQKFSNKFLKSNINFKLLEKKEWIQDFLSGYTDKFLNFNLDNEKFDNYIDKFLEIEKRILHSKLNNKLPKKMYEIRKNKI